MTARKPAVSQRAGARKSLAVRKRTLKNLSVKHDGPKGGFIMKDSIIVKTSGR